MLVYRDNLQNFAAVQVFERCIDGGDGRSIASYNLALRRQEA